jgi:hypothetical protein
MTAHKASQKQRRASNGRREMKTNFECRNLTFFTFAKKVNSILGKIKNSFSARSGYVMQQLACAEPSVTGRWVKEAPKFV